MRLSPEELLSKEMSDWRKTETTEVKQTTKIHDNGQKIFGTNVSLYALLKVCSYSNKDVKSQSGHSKSGSRQEGVPPDVDMEEAPPMSDGDVCMPATSQSTRLASAAVSAGSLAFLICILQHFHFSFQKAKIIPLLLLAECIICVAFFFTQVSLNFITLVIKFMQCPLLWVYINSYINKLK